MKHILVILGSTRQGRKGELVARWVNDFVETHKPSDMEFAFCDLREEELPLVDSPLPPMSGQYPMGKVAAWAEKIATYDGFLIITPEYNHGYPAVLKNALDLIYKEWNYKPVAFVSYGSNSGGIRAVEQLRQVVVELKMIPLKDDVSIPFIWQAFNEEGKLKDAGHYERALHGILDAFQRFYQTQKN